MSAASRDAEDHATEKKAPALVLDLLGRPQIRRADEAESRHVKYRKGVALLGYLAVNAGAWQTREKLADLFWPGLELPAARTNLRQVLNNLAAIFDIASTNAVLHRDDRAVRLVPDATLALDIAFLSDEALKRVIANEPAARRWREDELEPRLASLGGIFLEGLQLADTPEFDEWLETMRQHFRAKSLLLLEHVCRIQRGEGRLAAAIDSARLLAGRCPLDEDRCMLLMSLLTEAGDGSSALEAFEALRQRFESELGILPGERLLAMRDEVAGAMRNALAASRPGGASVSAEPAESALPELRWLVTLYCDFGMRHDEAADVDDDFIDLLRAIVQQRGGTVVAVAGRGVLAAFGLGHGVERSTERALLAACDLRRTLAKSFPLRMGLGAGKVLFRPTPGAPSLVGEVPDLTMRIGWAAGPGEIWASQSVARQAAAAFDFRQIGAQRFPGIEGEHALFQLIGAAAPDGDVQRPAAAHQDAPFTGRQDELAGLQALWREACAGRPRVAVVRAPAGLGKTRLVGMLARWVRTTGGTLHRVACQLELQHQPLAPVLASLDPQPETPRHDAPSARQERIARNLRQQFPGFREEATAALLCLADGGSGPGAEAPASKSDAFAALIELMERQLAKASTLIVVDDLHWSDLATRELLALITKGLTTQRVLLVITTRPDVPCDCPPSVRQDYELRPLNNAETLEMIALGDPDGLIPPVRRQSIAEASGGIPLFVERLIRSWQDGEHHLLPITELLQGELDRLGAAKNVLRAASVLGCTFRQNDLAVLLPSGDIPSALARAVAQRLIETNADGSFGFCHDLIRETVYNSLPYAQRKRLHERTARMLLERSAHAAEEIARHFSAAQCRPEAAEWWSKAGAAAMAREFAADAQACFQKAFDTLAALGERADPALALSTRLHLGRAAQLAEGFGSALGHRLYSEAVAELGAASVQGADAHENLFAALSGQYWGSSSQGELDGIDTARRLEAMARTDAERVMACAALGNSLFWNGGLVEAASWQARGIALAARMPPGERMRYCLDDPAIVCRAFHAWNLWFLGDEAAACATVREGIALAREGGRAHALCFMLTFGVTVHWRRRAVDEVVELASEALVLAQRHGFPLWEGANQLFLLWAQAKRGALTDTRPLFDAAALMQQAYRGGITTLRWIASDALMAQGEWEEAEKLLDLTIREADRHEDQYCLADLLWSKGSCLHRRGADEEAVSYLLRAGELAQAQQALGLLAGFANRAPQSCDTPLKARETPKTRAAESVKGA